MPEYDSEPVFQLTGHAIVNADTDIGIAVACPSIPVPIADPTGCQYPTPYTCLDKTTTPATTSCTRMRYLFPRHRIKHGTLAYGATGAYLPAVTVCSAKVTVVPVTRLRTQPTANHYGLPDTLE